jgi:hypothetical protein
MVCIGANVAEKKPRVSLPGLAEDPCSAGSDGSRVLYRGVARRP